MTENTEIRQPIIFLSYSHKDERDKDRLITQIRVLERAGRVDLWSDDRIQAGSDWRSEIDEAMTKASVAILIITANYLTSKFILGVEIPILLERHKETGLNIFPIIARDCPWEEVPWLASMNVRPKNGPVWRSGGRYASRELANIAREIAGTTKETNRERVDKAPSVLSAGRDDSIGLVEDAIKSIDAERYRAKRSGHLPNLSAIESIIHQAISYGAPLYNQGAIKGCAEIYSYTVKSLISLIEDSGYGPRGNMLLTNPPFETMPGPVSDEHLLTMRDLGVEFSYNELKGISTKSAVTTEDVNERAWDIRHSFDQIQFVSRGINAIDITMRSFRESNEPLSHLVAKTIALANSRGDLTYEEGLTRNRSWIKGCAVIYLYTAQTILSIFPLVGPPGDKLSRKIVGLMEAKLSRVISAEQYVTDENAYRVAWDIRRSFDRALEAIPQTVDFG